MKPLFARKRVPLGNFHFLDCAFQARLGPFLNGRDTWFDYGTDRRFLAETFEQNAVDSQRILSRYSKRWADPRQWLKQLNKPSSADRLVWGEWVVPKFSKFL